MYLACLIDDYSKCASNNDDDDAYCNMPVLICS